MNESIQIGIELTNGLVAHIIIPKNATVDDIKLLKEKILTLEINNS